MTEKTTVPDAQRDGKAQAAADKAYRKAQRPWFKKKRWWLVGLIILVIIFPKGGSKEPAASTTPATTATASAAAAAVPTPAPAAPTQTPAAPAPAEKPAAAPVAVQAATLLADFKANEAAADLKYKGKTLEVSGHVAKVDTELWNKDHYVVRLDNGEQYSILTVNCNGIAAEQAAAVAADSTVTVRGEFQDGGDLGVEIKSCKVL
jgi:pyruvate/2-oxoglutarate dehydrogenase complex dihydrolipoamide acyltransferase (E2) component